MAGLSVTIDDWLVEISQIYNEKGLWNVNRLFIRGGIKFFEKKTFKKLMYITKNIKQL